MLSMALISDSLRQIIRSQIESMGYILWGIEFVPRRHSYLARIYIDKSRGKEDKPLGIDDCALVNRALDACLQEENIQLEISTPGLARKLFSADQYHSYIGKMIKIKTKKMIDGQRNFAGELVSSNSKSVSLKSNGEVRDFLHSDIIIGQLELDYKEIFKQ